MNVLRCDNQIVRNLIEEFTIQYIKPHSIQFIQDGNGDWITSIENLQNMKLIEDKENLKQFLADNGIDANVKNLKEVLQNYCTVVPYVPPPDPEI